MLPAQLNAQEYVSAPVEISKEKIKVDGKICYSHVVLEKQTLYSISKAYGVTIDDIYKFNPSTKENGLKKNSIIIIPSPEATAATSIQSKQETIQKQETAQKEETAQKQETDAEPINQDVKAQRIHITKWTEDLDVIAEMYGVSVDDIIKANNLKGRKLGKRQKLIIPFPGEEITNAVVDKDVEEKVATEHGNTEAELARQEVTAIKNPETEQVVTISKNDIKAAILLPLTGNDGAPNRNNLDFYCGALLATYDLGNNGINTRLSVYDSKDKFTQENLETLNQSDIIIGPVSTADLTRMRNIAPDAPAIVSPLDPRAEKVVRECSNMIQIPTPAITQYQDLVSWIKKDIIDGDKVLMISEKGARLNNLYAPMKQVLDSSAVTYSHFSYSILEGRDVSAPLTSLMTKEGNNRVVIASESEAFVNDVIRNLNLLIRGDIEITLYSTSKIRTFETIEIENLHNLTTHVSLNYFIDYNDADVRDFLMKYRALYNTEPSQFAFQGYDIAKFCISMCSTYGDDWINRLETTEKKMLQSILALKKGNTQQGYINNGVRRIIYQKGYSVVIIK